MRAIALHGSEMSVSGVTRAVKAEIPHSSERPMNTSIPLRSPHLIRDLKTVRPGIDEEILVVPEAFFTPLLLGKLHAEVHEVALDPIDVDEYADVFDLLEVLARRHGHSLPEILERAERKHEDEIRHVESKHPDLVCYEHAELLRGDVHYHIEAAGRDLANERHLVAIATLLLAAAALSSISVENIEAARAAKSERYGGYEGAHFWRRIGQ